jgi:hypothetical protein
MAAHPTLYLAVFIGLTGRTDVAPSLALSYFLAGSDEEADARLAAMRADPAFPLYQEEDLEDVAAVANPVPLPRWLSWPTASAMREFVLQVVPAPPATRTTSV